MTTVSDYHGMLCCKSLKIVTPATTGIESEKVLSAGRYPRPPSCFVLERELGLIVRVNMPL